MGSMLIAMFSIVPKSKMNANMFLNINTNTHTSPQILISGKYFHRYVNVCAVSMLFYTLIYEVGDKPKFLSFVYLFDR